MIPSHDGQLTDRNHNKIHIRSTLKCACAYNPTFFNHIFLTKAPTLFCVCFTERTISSVCIIAISNSYSISGFKFDMKEITSL